MESLPSHLPSLPEVYPKIFGDPTSSKRTGGQPQPPRSVNSFIIFRTWAGRHLQPQVAQPSDSARHAPKMTMPEVSKAVSQMWHAQPEFVKAHYARLAAEADLLHKAKYPDYKYRPTVKQAETQGGEGSGKRVKKNGGGRSATRGSRVSKARSTRGVQRPVQQQGVAFPQPPHQPFPEGFLWPGLPSPPMSAASSPAPSRSPSPSFGEVDVPSRPIATGDELNVNSLDVSSGTCRSAPAYYATPSAPTPESSSLEFPSGPSHHGITNFYAPLPVSLEDQPESNIEASDGTGLMASYIADSFLEETGPANDWNNPNPFENNNFQFGPFMAADIPPCAPSDFGSFDSESSYPEYGGCTEDWSNYCDDSVQGLPANTYSDYIQTI